jgi:hypothetical protein
MELITTFSSFLYKINEGLIKTYDINDTVRLVETEMDLMSCYDFNIIANSNNTISLTLNRFNILDNINLKFQHINSMMINRYGWFPSVMKMENISGMKNKLSYDEYFLVRNKKRLRKIEIIYESKFDIEIDNKPNDLYHLSIQSYKNNILKYGLIPKSKSKLSKHLDRICVCDNIDSCKVLIPKMLVYYNLLEDEEIVGGKKPKRNIKWIIFKINSSNLDIKLYKDPNYPHGYYITDNIPSKNIIVVEEEK